MASRESKSASCFRTRPDAVDDLCVIRSMVTDDPNHPGGCLLMHTGERVSSRPSLGAWVTYGLGTENQNLPGFMAIGPGPLIEGARQYGASFLPAAYQGTFVSNLDQPLQELQKPESSLDQQRRELDALARLNELHRADRADDSRLSARIDSFELAYRMQTRAPEAFDLAGETAATGATVRTRPAGDRDIRPAMPAGAAAGRTRRAVRAALPHDRRLSALGPAQRSQGRARKECRWRPTCPIAGLAARPESSAACSTTRWSSGEANSAALRPAKARPTAATIIRSASRCGWPAAACAAA